MGDTGALRGEVVLDFSRSYFGAVGAAMLADFGATVIRVEPVVRAGGVRSGRDEQAEFAHRNKLSFAVDLDTEVGRQIVDELIGVATVVIVDGTPAHIDERGFTPERLRSLNPAIVLGRATGFGPAGPDRNLPPLDELAAARTGVMPLLPQPGMPPVYTGAGQMYTAVMLAFGIVTAIHHRHETGAGQVVDASLLGGNMYAASLDLQAYLAVGGDRFLAPSDVMDTGNPMSGAFYQSADDRWITLTMPDTDRWWPAFAESVAIDPADPRFDSHQKRCEDNNAALVRELQTAFRRRPAAEWRAVFAERMLSAEVIEDFAYPANDPHARRNRYIVDVDDPRLAPTRSVGFPLHMSESPARLDRTAPAHGQHTAALLHDMLGYSEDRIEQLNGAGVVR